LTAIPNTVVYANLSTMNFQICNHVVSEMLQGFFSNTDNRLAY